MASVKPFGPNRLVMGLLLSRRALLSEVLAELERLYGPIECASTIRSFTESDYYDREMGGQPLRLWVAFKIGRAHV